MNLSIKNRLYLSFSVLVILFVINGVISTVIIKKNNKLSGHITQVMDPSIDKMYDFRKMILESKMYITNWVFLRADEQDRKKLVIIQQSEFPAFKVELEALLSQWKDKKNANDLRIVMANFSTLIEREKEIMNSLQSFSDYDDPITRLSAERTLEDEILPLADSSLGDLQVHLKEANLERAQYKSELGQSTVILRIMIFSLAVTILLLGVFLAVYMTKIITQPINKINDTIKGIARGIIRPLDPQNKKDEIGEMMVSVNELSENLLAKTLFAKEIGKRNFESRYFPLSHEDVLGHALLTMRDNLRNGEKELFKTHLQMQTFFRNIDEVFFSVNTKENKLLLISPACEKIYGYSETDFQENSNAWHEAVISEDRKNFDTGYQVLHSGKAFLQEYRIQHKDGSIRWVETKITPSLDKHGDLARIDGVTVDITQRKNAEITIKESENKYRSLFEKMVDGVYKSSNEGKFIEVNPALVKMLGFGSREELLAIDIKSQLYFEPGDRDAAVHQDKSDGLSVFRLRKKDGNEIWVEDRGHYITDEHGNILYHEGILRDVTERVKAEFQLQKSQKETADYRKALDQSLIVSITDQNGIIQYANENFCSITGYALDELAGQDHRIINSGYHSQEYMKTLWETIAKGNVWRGEMKNKSRDGTYFWVDATVVPFLDERGKPYQYLAMRVDVTERKEADEILKANNIELKKTNSELDKFVYSVSHDLRAPLSSMLGVVEISEEETTDPQLLEHFGLLKGSITKLDGFIHDILSYSRNSRLEVKKEEINFQEMLHDISNHLKYMSGNNRQIELKIHVTEGKPFVSDKSRINVVLNNLISNAIRYQNPSADHPFVDVKIDMSDTETDIIIRDNGIGISKENQQKIFDMFYRVSENSVGSGLGLYLVKEIVDKLDGKIKIESELGKGTSFWVNLPNNSINESLS
ncbi:MAG: PAS domain-containing sensor histidine kinase [Bacteroidetes bacterium]|nr:PAS domain-containing sensor histidine kinase [Bacteroidota bacterium]